MRAYAVLFAYTAATGFAIVCLWGVINMLSLWNNRLAPTMIWAADSHRIGVSHEYRLISRPEGIVLFIDRFELPDIIDPDATIIESVCTSRARYTIPYWAAFVGLMVPPVAWGCFCFLRVRRHLIRRTNSERGFPVVDHEGRR